jgi:arylsulfatase A-like enzyme
MHVDRELGRFIERLHQWHGWGDLVLIVTADHGEMLGDYRDIVGHMLTLHDNILHVPLVIRHPDVRSGVVVEGVVQILDLYSTIVDWADADVSAVPTAQLQRPSYSRAMTSPDSAEGYAFAEEDYTDSYRVIEGLVKSNPLMDPSKYPRRQVAVHSATHKYVWYDDRPGELFDLRDDPDEARDLISHGEQHGVLREMSAELETWRKSLEIFPPRLVTESIDAADKAVLDRRLRDLGYLE